MRVITKGTTDAATPIQRFVTFYNAFIYEEEYNSAFTIYMNFTNPKDNFPREQFELPS
jgi:hypothetical protein